MNCNVYVIPNFIDKHKTDHMHTFFEVDFCLTCFLGNQHQHHKESKLGNQSRELEKLIEQSFNAALKH